jgi:hypothetical protein
VSQSSFTFSEEGQVEEKDPRGKKRRKNVRARFTKWSACAHGSRLPVKTHSCLFVKKMVRMRIIQESIARVKSGGSKRGELSGDRGSKRILMSRLVAHIEGS